VTIPAIKTYRLYIDESGDNTIRDLDNPARRFLGLTGVILPYSLEALDFNRAIEALKDKHFVVHPDEHVILHREDIVNFRGPFVQVKEDDKKIAFGCATLELMRGAVFTLITVVIDKKRQFEQYGVNAYDSYNFGLTAMLERYCGWLGHFGFNGDTVAEGRGRTHDNSIKEVYQAFYGGGSAYRSVDQVQGVFNCDFLKIRSKDANLAGLQLADLLANPSRRQILMEKGIIADERTDYTKEVCKIMDARYYRHPDTGRVWGFGKMFKDFR
jgi:hypothetical protein